MSGPRPPHEHGSGEGSGGAAEAGSVVGEFAIGALLLLTVTFLGLQSGMWWHARNVAMAAARDGVRAAAAEAGTAADGETRARDYVTARDGGRTLREVTVAATRGPTQASVTVTGETVHVNVIAAVFPVHQTAHFPVERVTG